MATVRAARVAGEQWGVVGVGQLRDCGVSDRTISRWRRAGRLHLVHRGVYALGHPSVPIEGRLVAALLTGGPGAALSHASAAWWWGLITREPTRIDVSAAGRARSNAQVRVHHPRHIDATRHRRLPCTTVARTLLDFAAHSSLSDTRRAVAEAEFKRLLDVEAVHAALGHGRPGAARLRVALKSHLPQLARTRSGLEVRFLHLCERAGLPIPDVNVRVGRMTVDALWSRERLAVELDAYGTHGSPARMERDRRRELHLRAAGFAVLRYTDQQLGDQPQLVISDLRAQLSRSAPSA